MKKDNKPILKRSLSTLLKRFSNTDIVGTMEKDYSESVMRQIKLSSIEDNHVLKKARINENVLTNAMNVISNKGLNTPIFVVYVDDHYEVVLPRLDYIAAKKLNLEDVPITLLNIDEEEMLLMLASYLINQKQSSIVELSLVLNRMQKKYHYTQKDIASFMHQSRSQITNIMRLKKMPQSILNDLANDKLSFGHARAISTLDNEKMMEIVNLIYERNLSVRETEKIVYELKHNVSFENEESLLNKKLNCRSNVSPLRVTLVFDDEEKQKEFFKKIEIIE